MNSNTSPQSLSDEARHLVMVPLFRRLDERELKNLAEEVDEVSFKSGEVIFHEFDQNLMRLETD